MINMDDVTIIFIMIHLYFLCNNGVTSSYGVGT